MISRLIFLQAKLIRTYDEAKSKERSLRQLEVNRHLLIDIFFAKDRAVTLNKTFRTLKIMFEDVEELPSLSITDSKEIIERYLRALDFIEIKSANPLIQFFEELYEKNEDLLMSECNSSRYRSHWLDLFTFMPFFRHNYVLDPIGPDKNLRKAYVDIWKAKFGTEFFPSIRERFKDLEIGSVWLAIEEYNRQLFSFGFAIETLIDYLFGKSYEVIFKKP